MIKTISVFLTTIGLLLSFSSCERERGGRSDIHPIAAVADSNLVLPPAWSFGVLYGGYTNQQQSIERIEEIIAKEYPIDGYWIDSWFWSFADQGCGPDKYIDFVADTIDFPDRRAMWDHFESQNIKGGFWVWDCIFEQGNEEVFHDFLEKGYFRDTYLETNPWHNSSSTTAMHQTGEKSKRGTLCGNIDFNRPEVVAYFKRRMMHFFDEGADFIKLDRTSSIPVCKAMFELTQTAGKESNGRGFILSHTGGDQSDEYKRYPGKWTDDTRSDWSVEHPLKEFNSWVPSVAFKENIALYLDPEKRSSAIPFLAQDLGGFDRGVDASLDEELYIRWMQFAFFCPLVTVFSQPENQTSNLAYRYSERADTLFRKYSHLRMQLFPYIYSYAHQHRLTGEPIIRKIAGQHYEYLFGNELFVAPIFKKGATTRTALFPAGRWSNFWHEELVEGGETHSVNASIEELPLFVRQGAIIPMRHYARSIEQGTNDTLLLHLYPGADSSFELIEDNGRNNDYLKGRFAKTTIKMKETHNQTAVTIEPTIGDYEGMGKQRIWELRLHTTRAVTDIQTNGTLYEYKRAQRVIYLDPIASRKDQQIIVTINY